MSESEISENIEHAHERGEKGIGLTTALWAVFLAIATLASHRAHTEEVKLQTQVNDQWGFYQAKHGRAHQYGLGLCGLGRLACGRRLQKLHDAHRIIRRNRERMVLRTTVRNDDLAPYRRQRGQPALDRGTDPGRSRGR